MFPVADMGGKAVEFCLFDGTVAGHENVAKARRHEREDRLELHAVVELVRVEERL